MFKPHLNVMSLFHLKVQAVLRHGKRCSTNDLSKEKISTIILDPDLECHLLTFFRLLVVFCHILSTTGE